MQSAKYALSDCVMLLQHVKNTLLERSRQEILIFSSGELPMLNLTDFKSIQTAYMDYFDQNDIRGTGYKAMEDFFKVVRDAAISHVSTKFIALVNNPRCTAFNALAGFVLIEHHSFSLDRVVKISRTNGKLISSKAFLTRRDDAELSRESFELVLNGENFQHFLQESFQRSATVQSDVATSGFTGYFHKIEPSISLASVNADYFYNGQQPTWSDIAANFDFPRIGQTTLIEQIVTGRPHKFYLVEGTGGSGKTTALKRIGFELAKKGWNAWYLQDEAIGIDKRMITNTVIKLLRQPKNVVIVDNIFWRKAISLPQLYEVLSTLQSPLIFSEHSALVKSEDNDTRRIAYDNSLCYRLNCDYLEDEEVEEFAGKITELENNEQLHRPQGRPNLSAAEKVEICRQRAQASIFVTLMELRYGVNFRQIIIEECKHIEQSLGQGVSKLYRLIAYFNTVGHEIPKEVVYCHYRDSYDMLLELRGNLFRDFPAYDWSFALRHISIATEIKHIFENDALSNYEILFDFLSRLNLHQEGTFRTSFQDRPFFIRAMRDYDKVPELFAEILDKDKALITRAFFDLVKVFEQQGYANIFQYYVIRIAGLIFKNVIRDRNWAESVIYDPFFSQERACPTMEEKKELASIMAERSANQIGYDIEEAYRFSLQLLSFVDKFKDADRAYFHAQHGRVLARMRVSYFLEAKKFFDYYLMVKENAHSLRILATIRRYTKRRDEYMAAPELFFPESTPDKMELNRRVLFTHPLIYQVLYIVKNVSCNKEVYQPEVIGWANDNLKPDELSRFYCNLAKILDECEEWGDRSGEVGFYLKKSISIEQQPNLAAYLRFVNFIKDSDPEQANLFLDKVTANNIHTNTKSQKLMIEAKFQELRAYLLTKPQNSAERFRDAIDCLETAEKNYSELIQNYLFGKDERYAYYIRKKAHIIGQITALSNIMLKMKFSN